MILNCEQIRERIKKGMVSNYVDIEKQLTPQSFDLSVGSVHGFLGRGRVDFSNKEREIPETREIEWSNGSVFLDKGHYKVRANEYFSLPENVVGIARPRSTLLRCGCTVDTGIWDAGFRGHSEFLLVVGDKGLELKKDARVISVMFFEIEGTGKVYEGIYKS